VVKNGYNLSVSLKYNTRRTHGSSSMLFNPIAQFQKDLFQINVLFANEIGISLDNGMP